MESVVECPNCKKEIRLVEINQHLDSCVGVEGMCYLLPYIE